MKTRYTGPTQTQLTQRQIQKLGTASRRLEELQHQIQSIVKEIPTAPQIVDDKDLTASGRPRNTMTLEQAILKVTEKHPRNLMDILDGVLKLGYKFSAVRPTHCVGAYLYGKLGKKVFTQTDDGTHRFFPKAQLKKTKKLAKATK